MMRNKQIVWLRRTSIVLGLASFFAVVLTTSQARQSLASEGVQIEPICKLDVPYAKRVLDAYEAVRDQVPKRQLETETEIDAFKMSDSGVEATNVLAALGFPSVAEWYRCLAALEDAYLLTMAEKGVFLFGEQNIEEWDTTSTFSFDVSGEGRSVVEELIREDQYLAILQRVVETYR